MKNKEKLWIYPFIMIGVLLILLCGCKKDDESAPNTVYPVSSLSFDYSGLLNGTYSVVGDIPLSSIYLKEWADAILFAEYGDKWIGILANSPTNKGSESNSLQMHIKNPRTGNFILPSDRGDFDVLCFGLNGMGDQQNFNFTSGSISVTTFQSNRIIGTFNGTLEDLHGGSVTISNGKFNMHVTTE